MRMFMVEQGTTLESLGARLVGGTGAAKQATMQRVKELNPHVDFQNIAAGTVLFVPDVQGIRKDESASIAGQPFDAFRDLVEAQIEAISAQVARGHEARSVERSEVQAVLKTAAVRRLLESNPELKPQLDATAKIFKQDQQDAKTSEAEIKALQQGAMAELGTLAKLLS